MAICAGDYPGAIFYQEIRSLLQRFVQRIQLNKLHSPVIYRRQQLRVPEGVLTFNVPCPFVSVTQCRAWGSSTGINNTTHDAVSFLFNTLSM